MEKKSGRTYAVTVVLSGRTENFDCVDSNGIITLLHFGNRRTTEASAISYIKRFCSLAGCRVERIVEVKQI